MSGDGALAVTMDGGGIVRQGGGGEVPSWHKACEDDVLVGKDPGQFQIRVGDSTIGVGIGDETAADVGQENRAWGHRADRGSACCETLRPGEARRPPR